MQVLCTAQSHKPQEDFYYICSNLKEMLSAVITDSRSGIDLASHQVVLPGTRSPFYAEHGQVREAVGSPWCLQREWCPAQVVHCPGCPTFHWPQEHHSVLVLTGHGVAMSIFWKILTLASCSSPFVFFPLFSFYSEGIHT